MSRVHKVFHTNHMMTLQDLHGFWKVLEGNLRSVQVLAIRKVYVLPSVQKHGVVDVQYSNMWITCVSGFGRKHLSYG